MRRLCALVSGLWVAACFVDRGPGESGSGSAGGSTSSEGSTTGEASGASASDSSTGSASEGSSTSTGTSTSTSTTAPTTEATSDDTTTTSTTTGEPTTSNTTGTSGSDATTSDPTSDPTGDATGGDLNALTDACIAYCSALLECGLGPTEECVADCLLDTAHDPNPSDACVTSAVIYLECVAALDCAQIGNPALGCPAKAFDAFLACPECKTSVMLGNESCAATRSCQVDHYTASCDATACECYKNDAIYDTCSNGKDVCTAPEAELINTASSCCGWP